MKKALFAFAAAAAVLAGCQMAEDFSFSSTSNKGARTPLTFTASIEDCGTRSALVADGDVYHPVWNLDDRIVIKGFIDANGGSDYYAAGEGGSTYTYFKFTAGDTLNSGPFEAFSPATVADAFPGIQSQKGNVCKWVPMRAFNADTTLLTFKNLGGMLKLNIKTSESGIVVKRVIVSTDQPMAGAYTLDGDAAVIAADGQKTITLDCCEGIAIDATPVPFFISVPANTYTGMTIQLIADGGKKSNVIKMKSGASFTVERSKYYEAEFSFDKFETVTTGGGSALLPAGPDFNTALKSCISEDAAYNSQDHTISKIIFDTNSANTEGTNIADIASDNPVYLSVDKASGIAYVSSPASEFVLPEDASFMFAYMGALEEIVNLKSLNTENVMNMTSMFNNSGCLFKSLKHLDLSNFKTANDTSMRSMFNSCTKLEEINVSNFNTENVESFRYMFQYCNSLKEVDCSNFKTDNVTDFGYMFAYDVALEKVNIKGFNTENAATVAGMFRGTTVLQEIICDPMDLINCTTVAYMFAASGLPVFNSKDYMYNTDNVGNFSYMFQNATCQSIVFDPETFSTQSVTTMDNMFRGVPVTSLDLSMFDVSNLSSSTSYALRSLFNRCDNIQTIDLRNWELNGNIAMTYIFYGMGNIKDVYLGEGFLRTASPTAMWTSETIAPPLRTGSVHGTFNIHCTQDTADWLATTTLRWVKSGFSIGTPCDVHFLDLNSGNELSVEWKAD